MVGITISFFGTLARIIGFGPDFEAFGAGIIMAVDVDVLINRYKFKVAYDRRLLDLIIWLEDHGYSWRF